MLHKMPIRPALTYDSECWSLTTKDDYSLQTFEERILRKIMGQLRKVVYGDQGLIMNFK